MIVWERERQRESSFSSYWEVAPPINMVNSTYSLYFSLLCKTYIIPGPGHETTNSKLPVTKPIKKVSRILNLRNRFYKRQHLLKRPLFLITSYITHIWQSHTSNIVPNRHIFCPFIMYNHNPSLADDIPLSEDFAK